MKKRSDVEPEEESCASPGARLAAQVELLAGVAEKALAIGRAGEAERLIASPVAQFVELFHQAESAADWEHIARMHTSLAKVLPRLEAVTGKRWTRCLDLVKDRVAKPMLPPRGQA